MISSRARRAAAAMALVVLVMFVFLQSWRATIIPTLTLPVSLVGAFAFVHLMGFSINTLTLFAIVLATGIVVDDAIVVVENVERHMREYHKSARQAAIYAMREVFGAVVVIGIVLVAVFVPGPAAMYGLITVGLGISDLPVPVQRNGEVSAPLKNPASPPPSPAAPGRRRGR